MSEHHKLTRRAFLASTTTTAAFVVTGCQTNSARVIPKKLSPNEKLNLAAIGSGGKGWADINGCKSENYIALCDADRKQAEEAMYNYPDAKFFQDYRQMLEEMPDLDGCTISTPDHTHAPAAYMAMKLGKHVYVQKPLTHTVAEARLLTKTAREMGVKTQMGNQGHSGDGVREMCEMLWSGAIGDVHTSHTWTNRPIWPQGLGRPDGADPIPETLDWDLWLGTAPDRPFKSVHPVTNERCYHPFVWRGWWDFGCGALGDMACHIMDPVYWGLKLYEATTFTVEALQQEGMTSEMGPNKSIIKYSFPARGKMGPVDVFWYDGEIMPPRPEGIGEDETLGDGSNGSIFVGEHGVLSTGTYGDDSRMLPVALMNDFKKPEPTIPRVPRGDHYGDWIRAIKGEVPAACSNFDYSGPFTEMVDFGNVALRLGRKMTWDSEKFEVIGDNEANALLTKEYRKGWELPC